MRSTTTLVLALTFSMLFAVANCVWAVPIMVAPQSGTWIRNNTHSDFEGVVGYEFSVASPITINALGVWDGPGNDTSPGDTSPAGATGTASAAELVGSLGDGLEEPGRVGIWLRTGATTGTLIDEATVPIGLTPELIGEFRYALLDNLTEILLTPGNDYVVGSFATLGGNAFYDNANTFAAGTDVIASTGFFHRDTFDFPDEPTTATTVFRWAGPNATFIEPPVVPEPSSFLLLGLGALGLVRHSRRRRRRA